MRLPAAPPGEVAALTERAAGLFALLLTDVAPCIEGQTVRMVSFRAARSGRVLVAVDGLDETGTTRRFDVSLDDLALPVLRPPRLAPPKAAPIPAGIFHAALIGRGTPTNAGLYIEVSYRGYSYTVVIPSTHRAHVGFRQGWGGVEFIDAVHATPEQDRRLRIAHTLHSRA